MKGVLLDDRKVSPMIESVVRPHLPLERLTIQPMASGELSLLLSERVSWEDFPGYARTVVTVVGGSIEDEADSPVERVWAVTVRGAPFWFSFDELGASLDSRDSKASSVLPVLQQELLAYASR